MFPKIIYVFSLLCVVNAAVITVNVFDVAKSRSKPEEPATLECCNSQACDQMCRRHGYTEGYCVNGRCECHNSEGEITKGIESLSISKEPAILEDCNSQTCDQMCHRYGYTGGDCVNGHCKCHNFHSTQNEISGAAESLSIPEEPATLEYCNSQACDQQCRNYGFNGGVCVNGRCKCHNFSSTEGMSIPKEPVALEDCNSQACDQMCRNYGFNGGVCVNGRCKCHNFRSTEGMSIPKEPVALEDCTSGACDQLCRRYGYNGGVCVNGHCRCHNFHSTEGDITRGVESLSIPKEPATLEDCYSGACDQLCRRYGYNGGVCVNGRCKCHNFRSTEGVNTRAAEPRSILKEPATLEDCNSGACDRYCRSNGLNGGICIDGRCVCHNYPSSTEGEIAGAAKSLSIPEEPATVKDCNSQACDHHCHKDGYNGGVCVNGRCKCHNYPNTEDEITRGVESLTIPKEPTTLEDCNSERCDQFCKRYGYIGGDCVNGRCKCHDFHSTAGKIMPATLEDCNSRACDQHCRSYGFNGGDCVNGRCRCHNFPSTEGKIMPATLEDCNSRACDQQCHNRGYNGGVCVNGRCKCHDFPNTEGKIMPATLEDCNSQACDQRCRSYGFNGGVCVNGRCKCHNFPNTEGEITRSVESLFIPKKPATLEDCNSGACDQYCRNRGFNGGDCVNGRCKCHNFHNTEVPTPVSETTKVEGEKPNLILKTDKDEKILPALHACNTQNCSDMCHDLNFTGGLCSNGACKCFS